MAIILQRQISDDEKKLIVERFGRICYATGHEISENEEIHFDHIKAFADDGASEIDNIAPMCQTHNLQKGRLPLEDFRIKLRLDEFFKNGQSLTLKHELQYFKDKGIIKSFGDTVYYNITDGQIELEFQNRKENFRLYSCPITKWKYFYATLPVEVINSDDDEDGKIGLQPRYLIQDKVFDLFRHFQRNTVLNPSIGRLYQNKILIFDGQHKIASLLWGERKEFELKVYIDPDPKSLNQTNISAHDKFAQTRFFASIMVAKLGSQFGKQFEEYKNLEDGEKKTEAGFLKFLKNSEQLSNADINKRFTSFIYDSILDESTNKIVRLVSKSNRSTSEYPITMDMLNKSIFSNFLYRYPTDDDLTSDNYRRDKEIANAIRLCNLIDEEILHKWDATKTENDLVQNKLNRMFRSKSIMAWTELLRDAVAAKLDITDQDEKAQIFYRDISDEGFDKIKKVVRRLVSWSVWDSPVNSEIDRIFADNKSEVKKYFRDKGLTTGYLLGATE
ncbi:MAG TPA: HNH endonuclease signature motif containing protein [Bacilli bacterium]|nr:HNH endonuclease signature motif containing protein [Bacilli bacterium]